MVNRIVVCTCAMCEGKELCTVFRKRNCVALAEWEERPAEDDENER